MSLWQASLRTRGHIETVTTPRFSTFSPVHPARPKTNLKSSSVSWIMFWMKWICREVRGAAPACPTTSAMFWESEEDTAADRAGPEGTHGARREQNLPNAVWFSLETGPVRSFCCSTVHMTPGHFNWLPFCCMKVKFSSKTWLKFVFK